MSEVTLKPCPLCGSGDIRLYSVAYHSSGKQSVIKCRGCGCEVRAHSGRHDEGVEGMPDQEATMLMLAKGRAREKWNRRAERTCRADLTEDRGEGHPWRTWECSACGGTYEDVNGRYERCPHCGARVVDAE